ncbi:hypothetical protein ACWF9G_07020 [Nocardia sp. NPDC055029]|uniref:hypothetical protein n=1 Tax=Nocardia sp. NPDC060259 TaxID=3347088 RepID=UPI003659A20D
MTEPRILLIGRRQSTLDVLAEELRRFGRDVMATNDRAIVEATVTDGSVDLVVIGGGLDDPDRNAMRDFVLELRPNLPVHMVPRQANASPATVIPFTNEQVVLYKVHAAAASDPTDTRTR